MTQTNAKKEPAPSQVRLVVEVDGNPVGFLDLDLEKLWPLIHHNKRDTAIEWMDPSKFDSIMRSVVTRRLLSRIKGRLYQTLGEEMVKAELDIENFALKAETAAQVFGRTKSEIEKFVAGSGRTEMEFHTFFWEYMLEEREITDLKKEWKAKDTPPR